MAPVSVTGSDRRIPANRGVRASRAPVTVSPEEAKAVLQNLAETGVFDDLIEGRMTQEREVLDREREELKAQRQELSAA